MKENYMIKVADDHRTNSGNILGWLLDNFMAVSNPSLFEELYSTHMFSMGGQWHSHEKKTIWYVVFEDLEAAMLFKLVWG